MSFDLKQFQRAQRQADRKEQAAERKSVRSRAKTARGGARPKRSRGMRGRASPKQGSWNNRGVQPRACYMKYKGSWRGDEYGSREAEGVVLDSNMLGATWRERLQEFQCDVDRHKNTRPDLLIIHSSISLATGYEIEREAWPGVIRAWLAKIGADGNFVAFLHESTGNQHADITWSRAKRDSSLVAMDFDYIHHREALHQVADGLLGGREVPRPEGRPQAPTTVAVSAQRRAQRRGEADPWINPAVIREALDGATTMAGLTAALAKKGIAVLPARRKSDDAVVGVLFRKDGCTPLAGSSIDRSFSLAKLQARLQANAQAAQALQVQEQIMAQQRLILNRQQAAADQAPHFPRERGG